MKKLTLSVFTLLAPVLFTISANAQTTVTQADVTIQPENSPQTDNWMGYTRNAGAISFLQGLSGTASGCGSLQLNTPTAADKAFLFNYDYNNTPLSAITGLSYATYQSAGIANQVAALNIVIDYNGADAGGQAVLVFEPVYNSDQGTVTANTWQTWDAFNSGNARWWSAQPINGVCAFDCFVTWNHIVANNPNAIIVNGFGVNQGSGNPGLVTSVDALTIGVNNITTTFDFEGQPCPTIQTKPNTEVSSSILAYPNPTNGELNIQLPVEKANKADIIIMDANGTVVESRKAKTQGQVETFDLSGNDPGLYFIKVVTKTKVQHGKASVK